LANTAYGRAFGSRQKLILRPRKQLDEPWCIEPVTRRKVRLLCRLGKLGPWTNHLAVVAAVDAVSDERPQLDRYRPAQFDSEIGDATSGVELVGCDDCLGRADVDAGLAGAAMVGGGGGYGEGQIGIKPPRKKPR